MLATLRQTAKRFSALLLLVAILLGGSVEAVACEPAPSAATSAVFADQDMGSENDAPGGQSENHGLCAQGHCHHGPQALAETSPAVAIQPTDEVRSAFLENTLDARVTDALKRPPRA